MLRNGVAIGTIGITRREPGPFDDKTVDLLETFADQAVIAIENARLFNETKEALEQQTATSEVLEVISSSPGELQPVFAKMLENATRVCAANFGILNLWDGTNFRTVAGYNVPPAFAAVTTACTALPTSLVVSTKLAAVAPATAAQAPVTSHRRH